MKKELFGSKKRIAGTLASVLIGLIWIAALTAPDEQAARPGVVRLDLRDQRGARRGGTGRGGAGRGGTGRGGGFGRDGGPGERPALRRELSRHGGFLALGLIEQLKFEGYSTADATYGVDAVSPDWNEQAAKSAESYLDMSGSRAPALSSSWSSRATPRRRRRTASARPASNGSGAALARPVPILSCGGYWLGEAIQSPPCLVLGVAAAIAWGWWRWLVQVECLDRRSARP